MMESFKNLILSIKDSLAERISNPLVSSYLFFLIAMNWKVPVILLFGEGKILDRMRLIDKYSYSTTLTIVVPLGLALIYVFFMPTIILFIQKYQEITILEQKRRKIKHELEMAIERNNLLEENGKSEMIRNRVKFDSLKHEAEIEEKYKQSEHDRKLELLSQENDIRAQQAEIERDEIKLKNTKLSNELESLKSKIENLKDEINILEREKDRLNSRLS